MWRDPGTPADSFYEVRPECAASVPESKFRIKVHFFFIYIYAYVYVCVCAFVTLCCFLISV